MNDINQTLSSKELEPYLDHFDGYYFIKGKSYSLVDRRLQMEQHARKMWQIARCMVHVIKRFPFVRAIFISGDLSKNVTDKNSDIDFFIVTDNQRLWICRCFLVLFKKIFLFNSKKFFCINYYVSLDHLEIDDKNIYTATELAHLKPLYNFSVFKIFMKQNWWMKDYLPHYDLNQLNQMKINNRQSILQKVFELLFQARWANKFDRWLMEKMKLIWKKRYQELTDEERDLMFRCRPYASKAHGGNFQTRVLKKYQEKLSRFGISELITY